MRAIANLIALAALALGAAGCGDEGDDGSTTPAPTAPLDAAPDEPPSTAPSDPGAAPDKPPGPVAKRQVRRTVRAYVAGLDDRDGAAVCALLAPRAIDQVDLPLSRGGCGPSLSASIGYRDPRGLPVFESARIAEVVSIDAEREAARAVITVVTEFADRREPSIEDDVIYLERVGGRWLVAKPSAVLYRAVGIADIPPSVLAPP